MCISFRLCVSSFVRQANPIENSTWWSVAAWMAPDPWAPVCFCILLPTRLQTSVETCESTKMSWSCPCVDAPLQFPTLPQWSSRGWMGKRSSCRVFSSRSLRAGCERFGQTCQSSCLFSVSASPDHFHSLPAPRSRGKPGLKFLSHVSWKPRCLPGEQRQPREDLPAARRRRQAGIPINFACCEVALYTCLEACSSPRVGSQHVVGRQRQGCCLFDDFAPSAKNQSWRQYSMSQGLAGHPWCQFLPTHGYSHSFPGNLSHFVWVLERWLFIVLIVCVCLCVFSPSF